MGKRKKQILEIVPKFTFSSLKKCCAVNFKNSCQPVHENRRILINLRIKIQSFDYSTNYTTTQGKNHKSKIMSVTEDERGFTKSEMQVMDPRQANFQDTVNLVERNTSPGGFQLVNPQESGKIRSQFDLVELAGEIQTADKFTRATAGSKLSVIAEQVQFLQKQAKKILEEAQRDKEINHMACNFKRIPGK